MKYNTPLYTAIKKYIYNKRLAFHMPGHKRGKGIPKRFKNDVFSMDLTELSQTDNLHEPKGSIFEAQNLAAAAFGAKRSFFLVNGATCGVQAMITAVCSPGDVLIVDRNCHSSVISALILTGVIAKYVYPEYIEHLGIYGGISQEALEKVLINNPKAKGVLITSPNYYGLCSDIKLIAQVVHRHNKLLLVDEAHGAHFYFNPDLPEGALAVGADICVHGAHKTMPALTQSGFLHVNSGSIDITRLKACLKLFQTSSPSFLLMAYLDLARSIMQKEGHNKLDRILKTMRKLREEINKTKVLYSPGKEIIGKYGVSDIDLTRLLVNSRAFGHSGHEIAEKLRDDYKVEVEMSDIFNIVCIVSFSDKLKDIRELGKALINITYKLDKKSLNENMYSSCIKADVGMPMREAFFFFF